MNITTAEILALSAEHQLRKALAATLPAVKPEPERPKSMCKSKLEERFAHLWSVLVSDIELERQYRFHPERRWRFDFAHPETRIAVELQGGVWTRGRHSRGAGQIADMKRRNAAQLEGGWTVLEYATADTTAVNEVANAIRERMKGKP